MEIDAGQAERRRDECRRSFPVRAQTFTVEEKFRVELSRASGSNHLPYGRFVHPEQHCHSAQIGREVDYRSHVQVAVRPSIQSMTDSRGERVVNGSMTKSALDTALPTFDLPQEAATSINQATA